MNGCRNTESPPPWPEMTMKPNPSASVHKALDLHDSTLLHAFYWWVASCCSRLSGLLQLSTEQQKVSHLLQRELSKNLKLDCFPVNRQRVGFSFVCFKTLCK